ncbi:MAG: thiamine diphosphokinase [Clostridiaceae bacterium]|nr:thiamine diphosphokinase [Clostridiaceae bacterium]
MKVLIVGSGNLKDQNFLIDRYNWADLVIAVDGGATHLMRANLMPHIVVGDFDSINPDDLKLLKTSNVELITCPVEKDFTDMELASDIAINKNPTEVLFVCATGSRLDHSIGNVLHLYVFLEKGIKASIEDENNRIFLVRDSIKLKKQENYKVSLLPLTPLVEGITTKGLYYPLKDQSVKFGSCFGVSNEFCEDLASITFKKGLALVILSKD